MTRLAFLLFLSGLLAFPAWAEDADLAASEEVTLSAEESAASDKDIAPTPAEEAEDFESAEKKRLAFSKLPGFLRWADPRLNRARLATTIPARDLPRGAANAMEELGRVAFRYPGLLGTWAAKVRLSCDVCHTTGGANENFWLGTLSGRRGQVDMTNAYFNPAADDQVFNPRPIPDLRAATAPFGTLAPQPSREAFIEHTIMVDFAGDAPPPLVAKALAAYLRALPETKNTPAEADPLARVLADHKGPAKMVRLAFDDLDRTLAVLEVAIRSKRPDVLAFVTRAARHEIGRLYERLDPQDPARKTLLIHGRQLAQVPKAAEGENWRGALRLAKSVRASLAAMDHVITARADLTFFNRLRIRYFLEPELMWQAMAQDDSLVPVGGVPLPPDAPHMTRQ